MIALRLQIERMHGMSEEHLCVVFFRGGVRASRWMGASCRQKLLRSTSWTWRQTQWSCCCATAMAACKGCPLTTARHAVPSRLSWHQSFALASRGVCELFSFSQIKPLGPWIWERHNGGSTSTADALWRIAASTACLTSEYTVVEVYRLDRALTRVGVYVLVQSWKSSSVHHAFLN
jgi:hypothetical protein